MATQAPIWVLCLLLFVAFLLPRALPSPILRQGPLWVRALWRAAVFLVLTVLLWSIVGSPLAPRFSPGNSARALLEHGLEAAWWIVAAQAAISLSRLFIVLETRPRETQIISDLLAAAMYTLCFLAIVNFVFELPVAGLLATSGVIAIVLGLALQSTLSDVFSGIAVGIERPYKAGDFVWVEGGIEGHVIQVNWRATRIATGHKDVAIIPNSVMAKTRVVNHSLPSTSRGDTVAARLDPRVPPARCMAVLTAATLACEMVVQSTPPSIALTTLQGDGAVYEITYLVPSEGSTVAARTEVLSRLQSHLQHAGIGLGVPGLATVESAATPSPADMLEASSVFGSMAPADRDLLAQGMVAELLSTGDVLIEQGAEPQAMFIIAEGAVAVTRTPLSDQQRIYRMSPGECLGAIGLIMGSPYGATATALTPVRAYRLDKAAIAAAMKARPELGSGFESWARRSSSAMATDAVAHPQDQTATSDVFLARLRGFLHRVSVASG